MSARKPAAESEERLEQVMARLEQIVASLEKGDLPLEDALKVFEEGVGLVKRGQGRLEEMEHRIEELMTDGRTQPLPESAGRQPTTTRPSSDKGDLPF
jgi:exodeoxyribonuclease VII small subunit